MMSLFQCLEHDEMFYFFLLRMCTAGLGGLIIIGQRKVLGSAMEGQRTHFHRPSHAGTSPAAIQEQ